jgi:hypothetical protein
MVEVLYDEATPEERARLERHLETCPTCAAEMDGLRRVRERMAAATTESAAAPRVLVLGRPPSRAGRLAWLAAAAAVTGIGLLAAARPHVEVGPGRMTISLGRPLPLSEPQRSEVRREIDAALLDYREQERHDRQAFAASLRDELLRRDASRVRDVDAMGDLIDRWSRTRQEDLRFVLQRLGSLEQRTGQEMERTRELLEYTVNARFLGEQ